MIQKQLNQVGPDTIQFPEPTLDRRIWSIREVYEYNGQSFLKAANHLGYIERVVGEDYFLQRDQNQLSPTGEKRLLLREMIDDARGFFQDIEAEMSRKHAQRICLFLDENITYLELLSHIQSLRSTFFDEIDGWKVIVLNEKEALIYDHGERLEFGSEVAVAFPSARHAMAEACRCYALSSWSACEYHCIGVIEIGFKALCRELAVTIDLDARDCDWGKMINAVESQIRAKGHVPAPRKTSHPSTWGEDEQFFNGCLTDLASVQKALRNPTMHFRKLMAPDQTESRRVLTQSGFFMRHLAQKIKETP